MNKHTPPVVDRRSPAPSPPAAARADRADHASEQHPPGTHAIKYSEGETGQSDESGKVRPRRTVFGTVLNYLVIAIVIGTVAAAVFMGDSKFVLLGLLIFIPYAFLLLAPVLLARATGVNKRRGDP